MNFPGQHDTKQLCLATFSDLGDTQNY